MWLVFVLITVIFLFLWIKSKQNYFKSHKVPYLKSTPILGMLSKVATGRQGIFDNIIEVNNTPHLQDEPFFGVNLFSQPALLIKDLDLIKKVLVTDFNSFSTRYSGSDDHDPLGCYHIAFIKDPQLWKTIRGKFSPFFSGAKLKNTFNSINSSNEKFIKFLHKKFDQNCSRIEVDLKTNFEILFTHMVANFTMGIEVKSFDDENDELLKAFRLIFQPTIYRKFEFAALLAFPKVMKLFGFTLFGKFTTRFMEHLVSSVIIERVRSGINRNDFVDMIIKVSKELDLDEKILHTQISMFMGGGKRASRCKISSLFLIIL